MSVRSPRLYVFASVVALLTAGFVPAPAAAVTFTTVSGQVTDAATGAPLVDACLVIAEVVTCQPNYPHTDAAGNYSVTLPSGVDWKFNFTACDYATLTKLVTTSGKEMTVNAALTRTGAPKPAANPATPTNVVYLPNITKTLGGPTGWDTPFIVQNVGATSTSLELNFYRFSDGCLITRRTVPSLAPGTSFADIPNSDSDLPGDTQFAVIVRSFGANVVSVVNEIQGEGAAFQALSYVGSSTGANKVYLPNVTRRFFGYDTPFIVQNLGTAMATAGLIFVSFDGTQKVVFSALISPGRSYVLDPDYAMGLKDGTQYSVTVDSDQPVAVVVNAHNELGAPVAYSHNGLAVGAATVRAPYAAKNAGPEKRFSPVVVQNVGTAAATPTLVFTPLGAFSPVQSFTGPSVQPGASWAFDVRYTNGDTRQALCGAAAPPGCLSDGEYSLVASATGGQIAVVVLPVTDTTAMAYTGIPNPSTRVFLPNVTRTLGGPDGWTTPIVLQSGGSAGGATLKWFRFADGRLVLTQNVQLPIGEGSQGAVRIDPREVAQLADDTQYAVVADGMNGTIAAIVIELANTGGDAAMIYEGFSGAP